MWRAKSNDIPSRTAPKPMVIADTALYSRDTPCTYAIQFTVVNNRLNMCVTMRSNDLWYGFCNDQYCFAQLQILVAQETDYELGSYYHFAHNLHLYEKDLGKFLPQQSSSLLQSKWEEYG